MRNRKEVKALLEHLEEEREVLPQISKLGSNNWDEIDEQILLLDYYLNQGKVPNMDDYLEDITNSVALWLLEYNTTYDDLVEELLKDGRD